MSAPNSSRTVLAKRLRMARGLAGLSQSQVADELGLHRPSVSEIEAGRRKVSAEELTRLADIYDVDISWLSGAEVETDDEVRARVELAARELAKLKPNDLDKLFDLLKALRRSQEDG